MKYTKKNKTYQMDTKNTKKYISNVFLNMYTKIWIFGTPIYHLATLGPFEQKSWS
jgi:hypothetical protein